MKKRKINKKQLAAGALAAFFLLMAVCTVLSRTAASMVVPKVTTGQVQEGKLQVQIQGKGTVETKQESLVPLQSGLRVEWVLPAGTAVKKDEVLLRYDKSYLQEHIEKKQAEIKKLELAVEQARMTGQPPARVAATEGAKREAALSEENYETAWEAYASAEEAYNAGIEEQQQILDGELLAAETEKEKVLQQAQELDALGEAEKAESLRQQAETEAEERKMQAQAVYDSAIQELEALKNQAEADLQAQESARTQAYNAYESAKEQDAAAEVNDRKTVEAGNYSIQSAQVDLELAQKELEKLKKVEAENAEVKAEENGVLKTSSATAGTITDDTSSLMFGWGGYQIKGNLSAEELSKAEAGDEVKIMVPGQGKTLKKKVGGIHSASSGFGRGQENVGADSQKEEQSGFAGVFYAELEEAEAVYGSEVSYEISRQTDTAYKQILPLSAIRQDTEGTYCLVAEQEETILGTEYRAKRISVVVVEKDSMSAAITSSLGPEDKVITGSNKDIASEDKVRLEE